MKKINLILMIVLYAKPREMLDIFMNNVLNVMEKMDAPNASKDLLKKDQLKLVINI